MISHYILHIYHFSGGLEAHNFLIIDPLFLISDERAYIVSGQVTYVNEGDLLNITCIVEGGVRVEPPANIFWYHRGEVSSKNKLSNMFTIFTGILCNTYLL